MLQVEDRAGEPGRPSCGHAGASRAPRQHPSRALDRRAASPQPLRQPMRASDCLGNALLNDGARQQHETAGVPASAGDRTSGGKKRAGTLQCRAACTDEGDIADDAAPGPCRDAYFCCSPTSAAGCRPAAASDIRYRAVPGTSSSALDRSSASSSPRDTSRGCRR